MKTTINMFHQSRLFLLSLLLVALQQQRNTVLGFVSPNNAPIQRKYHNGHFHTTTIKKLQQPSKTTSSSLIQALQGLEKAPQFSLKDLIKTERLRHRRRSIQQRTIIDDDDSATSIVPSYTKLLKFCGGPVAIWLSEPLLSLVDTTVVGLSGSLTDLAAMGPATTLMDLTLYLTYFLALAVTSQLGKALNSKDYRECQKITSNICAVAVMMGLTVSTLLWTSAPTIIQHFMNAGPTLTPLASRYCYVRAAAAPFAVLGMVAQAICLVSHDIKTPILAVGVASVVNLIGDMSLRSLVGVSAATTVSSIAACAVLMRSVIKKMDNWRKLEREEKQKAQQEQLIWQENDLHNTNTMLFRNDTSVDYFAPETSFEQDTTTTTTAVLEKTPSLESNNNSIQATEEQVEVVPYFSIPNRHSFMNLLKLSLPLAFNMWVKMACYFGLTVKAAAFGKVALASHNIMMRIFFFFGSFADALGQAAQTFLPAALYPERKPAAFRKMLFRLGVMASGVALFNYSASSAILQHCGRLVTKDATIIQCLQNTSIWAAIALALHPICIAISGTVIATRDFRNLVKTYAITAIAHVALLCRANTFASVWQALVGFQLVRLFNYIFWNKVTPKQQSNNELLHEELVM